MTQQALAGTTTTTPWVVVLRSRVTTAVLRDATHGDEVVAVLGYDNL